MGLVAVIAPKSWECASALLDLTVELPPFPAYHVHSFILLFILSKMQKPHLFRLSEPCRTQQNRHSSPSILNNSLLMPSQPKQSQLKYRFLHRLDIQSIDKKYELLQRLNRLTRIQQAPVQPQNPSPERTKQYSIESYYIFNEGDQLQRRYQPHRNTLLRQRGNQNIHIKTLNPSDMLKHQLKEHQQFIEKFKPKRTTGPNLAKKFRMTRQSLLRATQPF